MTRPSCLILAGPNGSGKTSIYEKILPPGTFVNADLIERNLSTGIPIGARQIMAGRLAVKRLRDLIRAKSDFVFETTLSSSHSLAVMHQAKQAGYSVNLLFVTLDTPARNVERVRFRVAAGGHDIPAEIVTRRYENSLANLPAALELADEAVIIDNSALYPIRVVQMRNCRIVETQLHAGVALHQRLLAIAERVARR